MTNRPFTVYQGNEKGRLLTELRGLGGRAYLTGGPVFGLVVIALVATGFAMAAIATWFSHGGHSAQRLFIESTLVKL